MANTSHKVTFSAEFKRDYVAILAILSFFLIVIGEIVIAVAIPSYLHKEDTMAYQVMRLRLLDRFDGLRLQIRNIKPKNDTVKSELKLVSWSMNLLADYLRDESQNLTKDEMSDLEKYIIRMGVVVGKASKEIPCSSENTLDTASYINRLIPKQ